MVRAGMPYGLPLESYVMRLQEVLVRLPDANVGVELYALHLICAEYGKNALQLLEPMIELITDDTERSVKIRHTINSLMRRTSTNLTTE